MILLLPLLYGQTYQSYGKGSRTSCSDVQESKALEMKSSEFRSSKTSISCTLLFGSAWITDDQLIIKVLGQRA